MPCMPPSFPLSCFPMFPAHVSTLNHESPHAGAWDYCGGETRLVAGLDPGSADFQALATRVEAEAHMVLGAEVRP